MLFSNCWVLIQRCPPLVDIDKFLRFSDVVSECIIYVQSVDIDFIYST
jgi:hypothetical protein